MDKHVKKVEKIVAEEQLDWVQQIAPTQLIIYSDKEKQPTQELATLASTNQLGAKFP